MLCFVFQIYQGRRSGDRHGGDVFTGPNEFMARKHEGLVPLMKNDSFDYIFFPSQKSTPEIGGSLFSRTDRNWMTKLKIGAEEITSTPILNLEFRAPILRSTKLPPISDCTKQPRRQYHSTKASQTQIYHRLLSP